VSRYIQLSLSRLMLIILLLLPQLSLAADKVVLQLKWKHQFQFAGYYAAQAQGYFAAEGLDVDIREVDSSLIPLDTVLSGKAQFGISDSSLVLARMQGKKPVVLATIFQHSPLVLLTLKSSGIINPLQLKGKKIMFSRDIDDAVLTAMFTEVGLSPTDYEQVPQSFNDDGLINQNIDAMSAYITNQAFALPQKNIPINIISPANYGIDFYGDMLFVEENYFKNNKQQALAFRRAAIKGWHYAIDNQEQMVDWIIKNLAPKKDKAHLMNEAKTTARMIQSNIVDLGYFSTNRFIRIADTYKKLNLVNPDSSFSGINYKDYLGKKSDDSKWIQAAIFMSALLATLALILWMHNFRLKAKIKDNTNRLEKANQSTTRYLNVINEYINSCVLSLDLRVLRVSTAWCRTLSNPRASFINNKLQNLLFDADDIKIQEMQSTLNSGKEWKGELEFIDSEGNSIWFNISAQLETNDETSLDEITFIAIDVSDHKRIEILSLTDSLTGIANRRHLDSVLQNEIKRMKRNNTSLSLLMLDVDFFKQYNDIYGHQEGDSCLKQLSNVLVQCTQRPADLAARYGGEEFILLLPEADNKGANTVAELVMKSVSQQNIEHSGSTVAQHVTVSIGIATVQAADINTPEEIIKIADERLYKAKSMGRNTLSSN
jgi:diguanylate cyclase (GGDEF)-like protein